MLGYYTTGGDGSLAWRSGYRPGCSPQEKRHAAYLRAKDRKALAKAGLERCRLCGKEVPARRVVPLCDFCLREREQRALEEGKLAAQERRDRLRHGKGVITKSASNWPIGGDRPQV